MGKDFKGVYNLYDKSLLLFQPNQKVSIEESVKVDNLSSAVLDELVGQKDADQLRED
ncbi:MAG: hypothetical protein RL000_1538, partial [Bacteroidota bacterium]